jgi:hypothetical protein
VCAGSMSGTAVGSAWMTQFTGVRGPSYLGRMMQFMGVREPHTYAVHQQHPSAPPTCNASSVADVTHSRPSSPTSSSPTAGATASWKARAYCTHTGVVPQGGMGTVVVVGVDPGVGLVGC